MPNSIEVPHTGNKAVDWAVHSATINVVTKVLIAFIALMIPAFGWFIVQGWQVNREAIKEVREAALRATALLETRNSHIDDKLDKIADAVIDLKVIQHDLDTLRGAVVTGFGEQGRRIDKNDHDIETLRKEMFDRYVPPGTVGGRPR